MPYVQMIAGLPQDAYDHVAKISAKRLAPEGKLIMKPLPGRDTYPAGHHKQFVLDADAHVLTLRETELVQTLLVYADYGDDSTGRFLDAFFPFCLSLGVTVPDTPSARNGNERNRLLNDFAEGLLKATVRLREVGRVISEQTDIANLTPLLLPLRNFRSGALRDMLHDVFLHASGAEDPKAYLKGRIDAFLCKHPRAHAPGALRHCLSDGILYFQSPGKDLHGFRRNITKEGHAPNCLLNARSRVGGRYRHNFHYDCIPVKGKLRSHYENCHGSQTTTKDDHVNIAPNDYII